MRLFFPVTWYESWFINLISLLLFVSFSELLSPNTFTEVPGVLPDKWRRGGEKNDAFAAIKMSSLEAHNETIGSSTKAHLLWIFFFPFRVEMSQQLIKSTGFISVTRMLEFQIPENLQQALNWIPPWKAGMFMNNLCKVKLLRSRAFILWGLGGVSAFLQSFQFLSGFFYV